MLQERLSEEQRARGFRTEARFFHIANHFPYNRPRGLLKVEQAPAIMDVRGIDGFVWHYRGSTPETPVRIPIQLKSGLGARAHCAFTKNGLAIPIVPATIRTAPRNIMAELRRLLDAHDRTPKQYEGALLRAVSDNPPTPLEQDVVALVESARERYTYDGEEAVTDSPHITT